MATASDFRRGRANQADLVEAHAFRIDCASMDRRWALDARKSIDYLTFRCGADGELVPRQFLLCGVCDCLWSDLCRIVCDHRLALFIRDASLTNTINLRERMFDSRSTAATAHARDLNCRRLEIGLDRTCHRCCE